MALWALPPADVIMRIFVFSVSKTVSLNLFYKIRIHEAYFDFTKNTLSTQFQSADQKLILSDGEGATEQLGPRLLSIIPIK